VPDNFHVGSMVTHPDIPGIGRVGDINAGKLRVDCFESVVEPIAKSWHVAPDECRPMKLQMQTRVYWQNRDTGAWHTGRVVGGDQEEYFVRLPNNEVDFKVPESQLRVRWDIPVRNPVDVLVAGANESGYFSNTRLPMIHNLIAQRGSCGSAYTLLSSGIEIFRHQVRAAMTIVSDPVQRYLLADEVGLGKTIEAGLVIRQVLLDNPISKIVVIAPDALRRQWQEELRNKFFIGDFPSATIKISSHETPEGWQRYRDFDLVVIDEAHRLVQADRPDASPYGELAALAHAVERVLLLSATPLTSRVTTHLALLHLLDPHLYKWTEREAFGEKFLKRKQLANAVFALDADFAPLLASTIKEIKELIPTDPQFQRLAQRILDLLTEDGDLRCEGDQDALTVEVEALRAHISETYRLHRRMIRHRRLQVTADETLPYGLTGRAEPTHLVLDTDGQQLMQEVLLGWQADISDWLVDEGREEEAPAYGLALGVLISRADNGSQDLANALRWRLNQDRGAADRAGLTLEERRLLATPLVAALEQEILNRITDKVDDAEFSHLAQSLRPVFEKHRRVVVFCGGGALAAQLAATLSGKFSQLVVGEHTRSAGPEASDAAVAAWRIGRGALVADDTAEDGLNLQMADAVVHVRLPWSPNRLEQRIGRVDRYQSGLGGQASAQFAVASPGSEFTLPGAWLSLLTRGFGIFGQSLSALQDTIDQGLPGIWGAAALDGPAGLTGSIVKAADDLRRERREIDSMDMLESIHDARTGVVDIAAAIADLEGNWRQIKAATAGFASGDGGGLGFRDFAVGPGGEFTQFERGSRSLLVPPRILAQGGTHLTAQMMRGAFDRSIGLKVPGTRMLRSGNPFVDMLARTVWVDDRGQATVTLRHDPHEKGAVVYFGFDFLVEADISGALELAGTSDIARRALRRQADCLLTPFTRRVWIQLPGKTAIDHPGQLDWLNRPYRPREERGNDINLNAKLIGHLFDLFGGRENFTGAARFATKVAESELARVSDLTKRCDEARQYAAASLAVRRVQADARRAAGRIVTDVESYAADISIADALIAGLTNPITNIVSVTCLVRGSLPGVDRG
jgi:ATP-dependent helicase HepA